jgi:peptidoglycan/LPS O-acetylase OafA/YrhL
MLACMLFALVFRIACITTGTNEVIRWVTLMGCLDSFAMGALIAYMKQAKLLEKIHLLSSTWMLALPLAAFACYFVARWMTTLQHDNACLALAESFDACFLAWLLVAALTGVTGRYGGILSWSPLVYLGQISYGIYVYHVFIIVLLSPWLIASGMNTFSRTLVLLSVTLAFSALSWHWLEQPIIAWKNRLGEGKRVTAPKTGPAFA